MTLAKVGFAIHPLHMVSLVLFPAVLPTMCLGNLIAINIKCSLEDRTGEKIGNKIEKFSVLFFLKPNVSRRMQNAGTS